MIAREPAGTAAAAVPAVRRTLRRVCGIRRERIPDIGAVRLALEGAFETVRLGALLSVAGRSSGGALPYAVGAVVASIVVGVVTWSLWSSPPLRPVSRFDYDIPVGQTLRNTNRGVIAVALMAGTSSTTRMRASICAPWTSWRPA